MLKIGLLAQPQSQLQFNWFWHSWN